MQNYNNYNIQPSNFQKTLEEGDKYYVSAFLMYSTHAKPF